MRRFIFLGLVVFLLGCDTVYGVRRYATLDTFPPLDCVRTVLNSTPEIRKVEYREDEGGTALTLSGPKPEGPTFSFLYTGSEGSHIHGALQVHQDHRRIVSFRQTLLYINGTPPQEDVDATRPVMHRLEIVLAEKCGIPELPTRVAESCSDVQCGSLP